jgi:hypothetical protein
MSNLTEVNISENTDICTTRPEQQVPVQVLEINKNIHTLLPCMTLIKPRFNLQHLSFSIQDHIAKHC